MSEQKLFSRTERLLGREAMEKLQNARVAVFGIGGVGGYVVEALARSGVGALDIIDNDQVSLTNRNRQIIALESTVGRDKTERRRSCGSASWRSIHLAKLRCIPASFFRKLPENSIFRSMTMWWMPWIR